MGLNQDLAKVRAGSLSPFFNGAVSNTVVDIKASAGAILAYLRLISGATAAFLQMFNKPAAQVTLGTTVPAWVVQLAASQDLTIVNGLVQLPQLGLLNLGGSGLSIAWTTTSSGSTAPANAVSAHALYL